jgi:hypothetical protein
MFTTPWKPLCASAAVLIVGAALIGAQPDKKPMPPKPAGQPTDPAKPAKPPAPGERDMAAMMQAAQPSEAHKGLAKRAGEFTTISKFSMPGMPEQTSKGTSKLTMILGGRFLSEDATGEMMGAPYTSLKLVGYNNESKKYEAVWAYTQSTAMMMMTGTSDDDGKTINYTASVESVNGKETFGVKMTQPDDDHFKVEMLIKMPDGSAGPTYSTEYTRKK